MTLQKAFGNLMLTVAILNFISLLFLRNVIYWQIIDVMSLLSCVIVGAYFISQKEEKKEYLEEE